MSRALKKKKAELERQQFINSLTGSSDSEDSDNSGTLQTGNAFGALTLEDHNQNSSSSSSDSDQDDNENINKKLNLESNQKSTKLKQSKKSKKINKEFDLDKAVKEASLQKSNDNPKPTNTANEWKLDKRLCDPSNEIKRLFGVGSTPPPRNLRIAARFLKFSFGSRLNTWPLPEKMGISMKPVGESHEFKLVYSEAYQTMQVRFYHCVASLNPDTIGGVLYEQPYHLDSLVLMANVAQTRGDHSLAFDYLGRALYGFEQILNAKFRLFSGECRLPYPIMENRCVHLALFGFVQYLGRRGCWRTALECAKVLYFLDVETDPLFTLDSLIFYGIQAKQYSWVAQICASSFPPEIALWLPSLRFGAALALFHSGKTEQATDQLRECIVLFKDWIPLLFEKCSIRSAYADSPLFSNPNRVFVELETKGMSDPFFASYTANVLANFYIEQSYQFWKVPSVSQWLQQTVDELARSLMTTGSPLISVYNDIAAALVSKFRATPPAFAEEIPLNLYRKIFLTQSKAASLSIFSDSALLLFDPLPHPLWHDPNSFNTVIVDRLFKRNPQTVLSQSSFGASSLVNAIFNMFNSSNVSSGSSSQADEQIIDHNVGEAVANESPQSPNTNETSETDQSSNGQDEFYDFEA